MGLGGTFEESVTFQINPRITFTDMCSNFPALTKESLDYWVNSDPSISSVWDISNILLFSGNWTEIGNYVFNGFSKPAGYSLGVGYDRTTRDLGEILPESLKHIGIYAFNDVLDIDTLTFDNTPNLETIGKGAFANNGISGPLDLSPLTKLERIGYNSDALTMMVAADLRNLDSQTIRTRDTCGTSFTASAIGVIVGSSPAEMFTPTTDFGMGEVNTGAFQNNSFTSLNLSGLSNLKLLGTSTFERNDMSGTLDLTSLTNLETISPCVFIHNKFNGTLDLSQLIKIKNIYNYAFAENLFDGSLIFGTSPSLESIGQAAFAKNKFTGELDLSPLKNLRSIGRDYNSKSDTTMPFNFNSDIFVAGANIARPSWEKVPPGVFQDNSFTSVNFTDLSQITTIGNSAFENNKFSNGIDLSPLKKLKTIAPCAFENSVTQGPLVFGNSLSLEYIDSEAFVDNSFTGGLDLSGLTNLKRIGYDAFKSGNFSGSLKFPASSLLHIGQAAFAKNKFTGELDLSPLKNLRSIGHIYVSWSEIASESEGVFQDNNFTSVNFTDLSQITTIGNSAFENNKFSNGIDLSPLKKLSNIGACAFENSVTQGPLIFGNSPSLEYIDSEAFVDNSFTGGLDLSGLTNLKRIGYDAFKSCKFSGSLNFKDLSSLEIIDSQAFADNSFTSISFENVPNLTEIPSEAFKNNDLSGIIDLSPLINLRKIGANAFDSSFENITKIIIPAHADTSFEIEPQNLKGSGFNGLKTRRTLAPDPFPKTIYSNSND